MIIGLCGRARSGKTTAAEAIVHHAHRELGLTAKIYDIGQMILRYCIDRGFLPNKQRADLTPDELKILVDVGKEKRDEYEHYWTDRLFMSIQQDNEQVAVIPNIRYQNEVAEVRERGGVIARVTALNPNGSEYISTDRDPNHPSETEVLNIVSDFFITAFKGESALVADQAITIFEYAWALKGNHFGRSEETSVANG